MNINKIKISAVSYLNTLPFLYGIKNSQASKNFAFELCFPSLCAKKLIENEVDISLIPVASIPLVKNPYFISDYCIGAINEVKSVLLLSEVPLNEIREILLDYQSSTSVKLVQILAKKYWNIAPKWIKAEKNFESTISRQTAGVVIGDRTFSLCKKYEYVYDLASEWNKLTGLPFVFATWIANKEIDEDFIDTFNQDLKYGITHIREVADEYQLENPGLVINLFDYLTQNISFLFDLRKKESLRLFYKYLDELNLIPNQSLNKISF